MGRRKRIAVNAVGRAAARRAGQVRLELTGRLHGVAAVPPALFAAGLWGTTTGVLGAFRVGGVSEAYSYWGVVLAKLAEALALTALGLGLAFFIWICHRRLALWADVLSEEMERACLDVANMLAPFLPPEPASVRERASTGAASRRAAVLGIEHRRGVRSLAVVPVVALFASVLAALCELPKYWDASAGSNAAVVHGCTLLLPGFAIAAMTQLGHAYLSLRAERMDDEMAEAACAMLALE